MGCVGKVWHNQMLVFSICTHDPDTGVLTDADSVPTYRIYEDEVSTPVKTGTMSKLDDANTTGFYSASLTCSTQNGFRSRKTYNIYIEATVDSDKGGISYSFLVRPNPGFEPLFIASTYYVKRLADRGVPPAASGGTDYRFQPLHVQVFYKVKRRDRSNG